MRLFNVPQELMQPDGNIVNCFASGDEHFNWLHDKNGYIIIRDKSNGFLTYANYVDGKLVSSQYVVRNDHQENLVIANTTEVMGLVTINDIKISPEDLFYYDVFPLEVSEDGEVIDIKSNEVSLQTSPTGTINNIVIFIRFSDEIEFTDLVSKYNGYFNDATAGVSSVYNYFLATSYGNLFVYSYFYPTPPGTTVISYQDVNPRSYYEPYNVISNPGGYQTNAERTSREQILLKNAVNSISALVPVGLNLDNDGDGYVDDVTFIVKGAPDGWNDLLWPHQWSLFAQTAFINGIRVWDYNFELNDALDVGVICHETQHVIGFPDLYNYVFNPVDPVYRWDLMDSDRNPPQYSLAYCKYMYGLWIATIPEIITSGTYVLNPLSSSTGNAYRFKGLGPSTQFFTVEYRRRDNVFENSLPGSGLIVSRIDTTTIGNSGGPPNGVYVFRPGGTTVANGTPANAYLSLESGRTSIGGPSSPLFYQDGTSSGIVISNISSAGATISFGIVLAAATANLSMTKAVNKAYASIGDILTYTLVLKNTGDTTALNVTFVDTLPNGTMFLSGSYLYNGATTTISNPASPGVNLGSISAGNTSTVTLNVKVL